MGMCPAWLALVSALMMVGPASGSPSVAVVRVPEISEKYAKTSDLEAQFDTLRKAFAERRDDLKRRIEAANRSLQEELRPGTDEFRERRRQVAIMDAELQAFTETEGEKLEAGLSASLRSIFVDIQAAVQEIAMEKNIDVVLAADQLPPESPSSTTQMRQQILLQKVLYWNPQVDVTSEVIERVNARYKAAGGAASIAAAAAPPPPAAPPAPPKPAPKKDSK